MHAISRGDLRSGSRLVFSGRFDLLSGPTGWRAVAVGADEGFATSELTIGKTYRLRLPSRESRTVTLETVHRITGEARFAGHDDPPSVIEPPADLPRARRMRRWSRRTE